MYTHFRPFLMLLVFTLLGAPGAQANHRKTETTFTAVGVDSRMGVILGVMRRKPNWETFSKLMRVDSRTFYPTVIPLPKAARDREIIAIIPGDQEWLVMTQITVEQGDNPQVHAYAPVKKKWRELGEVECPLIDSMRAEKDRLVFECEETDETGKFYKVEKMLAFGGVTGVMPATLERNARSAQRGGASARLEGALGGDEDKWDRVRITRGKTRRSIKAN